MSDRVPFNFNQDIIGVKDWGSPFATYARQHYPRNLNEVWNWAEYLWLHHGIYTRAIQRAVRYFLNKVEIFGTTDFKIRQKYNNFLNDELNILDVMGMLGDDYMAYGNSFSSVYRPFYRNLICPTRKCGFMAPIEKTDYKWHNWEFHGKCPRCHKEVTFKVKDIPDKSDTLRIIRWNPRDIEIEHHPISGESRYYWEPKEKVKQFIMNGHPLYVQKTPMEMIEAIRDNKKFLFDKDEIYHMRMEPAASMSEKFAGWGLPPFLSNFEYVIHLQIMTKYNEAIALDMIVPFRFLSPGVKGPGPHNDPLLTIDAGRFMRSVEKMIKEHRKDPTVIHSVPYPVQYQAMGGEAKAMAPVDLMKFALDQLLTSMGIPQELYSQNLQTGGPPIGLRMFERSWGHFISQMNNWLNWLMYQCSHKLMWEDVEAKLIRTSVMEDDLVRQTKLNLLGANKVSNQTALSAFNIDYTYEVDKILEEQAMFDEKMQEISRKNQQGQMTQQQMDQPPQPPAYAQQGGMSIPQGPGAPPAPPPAGGGGAPMPPGQPGSIDELMAQADQMAQQIITMDPVTRRSQLLDVKKGNESLHALVIQRIKDLENQAKQTGVNMTRQGQIPIGGR